MKNMCHISRPASKLRKRTTGIVEYKNKFIYQPVDMLKCIKTSAKPKENVSFAIDNFVIFAVVEDYEWTLGKKDTKNAY